MTTKERRRVRAIYANTADEMSIINTSTNCNSDFDAYTTTIYIEPPSLTPVHQNDNKRKSSRYSIC